MFANFQDGTTEMIGELMQKDAYVDVNTRRLVIISNDFL